MAGSRLPGEHVMADTREAKVSAWISPPWSILPGRHLRGTERCCPSRFEIPTEIRRGLKRYVARALFRALSPPRG